MTNIDPIALHKTLSTQFSIKQIQALCVEMKIDYENLGSAGKSGKTRELVQFTQRRGRLDELTVHVYNQLEQMSQQETTAVNDNKNK